MNNVLEIYIYIYIECYAIYSSCSIYYILCSHKLVFALSILHCPSNTHYCSLRTILKVICLSVAIALLSYLSVRNILVHAKATTLTTMYNEPYL